MLWVENCLWFWRWLLCYSGKDHTRELSRCKSTTAPCDWGQKSWESKQIQDWELSCPQSCWVWLSLPKLFATQVLMGSWHFPFTEKWWLHPALHKSHGVKHKM
jgi:hypothetical protein